MFWKDSNSTENNSKNWKILHTSKPARQRKGLQSGDSYKMEKVFANYTPEGLIARKNHIFPNLPTNKWLISRWFSKGGMKCSINSSNRVNIFSLWQNENYIGFHQCPHSGYQIHYYTEHCYLECFLSMDPGSGGPHSVWILTLILKHFGVSFPQGSINLLQGLLQADRSEMGLTCSVVLCPGFSSKPL